MRSERKFQRKDVRFLVVGQPVVDASNSVDSESQLPLSGPSDWTVGIANVSGSAPPIANRQRMATTEVVRIYDTRDTPPPEAAKSVVRFDSILLDIADAAGVPCSRTRSRGPQTALGQWRSYPPGSCKRIPRKNIKAFLGKPILGHVIEILKDSQAFDEIVSTDDTEIKWSNEFGADSVINRPEFQPMIDANATGDTARDPGTGPA